MRLSFANGEHADFVVDGGAVSLGSVDGNSLVLPARDVAARHARLTVDARGIVLEVLEAGAQTHVNARPVREKALLRCGDILCLGRVAITLKADRDDLIETPVTVEAASDAPMQPPRVVLRGVSGSYFGRSIAVNQRLLIGRDTGCGLVLDEARIAPQHARIETIGHAIHLRGIDGVDCASVNGVRVSAAIVYPGDQLAFGRSHFVIEAPGLPLRGDDASGVARAITETLDAVPAGEPAAEPRRGQGGIWWLIGAAALIALALALVLYRGV